MLIAVATDDGKHIAQHFGRCAFFSIWQKNEGHQPTHVGLRVNTFTAHGTGEEVGLPNIPLAPPPGEIPGEPVQSFQAGGPAGRGMGPQGNPGGQGMHSHVRVLGGLADVQVVIAAGMGRRMVDDFQATNKEIFITRESEVVEAVEKYFEGSLTSGEACAGH